MSKRDKKIGTVEVEGSLTPSTFLARGERITVQRTEFIDKLIRRGFIVEVEHEGGQAE